MDAREYEQEIEKLESQVERLSKREQELMEYVKDMKESFDVAIECEERYVKMEVGCQMNTRAERLLSRISEEGTGQANNTEV